MKPLRFIHISKTGGQSIAIAAKNQAGMLWGMNDEAYGKGILCHRLLSVVNSPSLKNDTDKNTYDWFMVVRNPYNRAVSEYNWSNVEFDINIYLQRFLSDVEEGYIDEGQHISPQYKYLEKQYNIHVLRFENLNKEFHELMNKYGLSITLKKKVNVSEKNATLLDLNIETIEMINRVYEKDFTTFGYEMVHSVFTDISKPSSALPSPPEVPALAIAPNLLEHQTDH